MKYIYKTRIGTFSILMQSGGRWGLWINDDLLGSYQSPESAANNVYTQTTGYYEWDSLDPVIEPCDLSEWVHTKS